MTPTTLLRRYVWLVETIRRAGYITKTEIDSAWADSIYNELGESVLPERTFHRHKNAIAELFGIEIGCSRARGNAYYIASSESSDSKSMTDWLIKTLSVGSLIASANCLSNRILLENNPSGEEYLSPIIQAMQKDRVVLVTYWGFHDAEKYDIMLKPLCLKVFKQRWYMVGRNSEGRDDVYSLDRIFGIRITDERFEYPVDFDGEKYFADFYGVEVDPLDGVETVRIKVSAWQSNYLRQLPLHSSQHEVDRTNEYSIFEINVVPSIDFLMELRTHGRQLEVLSPKWVRDEMLWEARETVKTYRKK